jgi:hypothetical protein
MERVLIGRSFGNTKLWLLLTSVWFLEPDLRRARRVEYEHLDELDGAIRVAEDS